MATLVDLSRRFGQLIQLRTPGFLSNLRQHRMCGLAIIHMAQQARAFFRKDTGEGGGVPLDFNPKGSRYLCMRPSASVLCLKLLSCLCMRP
jgi:hypothetical protein